MKNNYNRIKTTLSTYKCRLKVFELLDRNQVWTQSTLNSSLLSLH